MLLFYPGPPSDENGNILSPTIFLNETCGMGWICEHRWHEIIQMINFRNVVENGNLTHWWDNGNNQIGFCRGTDKGHIFFNNDNYAIHSELLTCLSAGTYCDIMSGRKIGNTCTGKQVVVQKNGIAKINVKKLGGMLAIHVGVCI